MASALDILKMIPIANVMAITMVRDVNLKEVWVAVNTIARTEPIALNMARMPIAIVQKTSMAKIVNWKREVNILVLFFSVNI